VATPVVLAVVVPSAADDDSDESSAGRTIVAVGTAVSPLTAFDDEHAVSTSRPAIRPAPRVRCIVALYVVS
jgi:hypothetical protein